MNLAEALHSVDDETWEGTAFPAIERGTGLVTEQQESQRLSKYATPLWNLGFSDGVAGQTTNENVELIRRFASLRKRDRLARLSKDLVAAESSRVIAEELAGNARKAVDSSEARRDALVLRREEKPHEFSPLSGLIFLLVSIILIISDIPLTIDFVGRAMNMDTQRDVRDAATGQVTTVEIANIIFGPMRREAALALWQVVALALGISLLGMFFKLASDFLLGDSQFFLRYSWLVHFRAALQSIFFIGAFLLVCVTLWNMGALRAVSVQKRIDPSLVNSTFTWLAIALPTIGGICFSLGQKRMQNWWQLVTSGFRIAANRRVAARAARRVAIHTAEAAFLKEEIDREKATMTADPISVPEKLYVHAFERGARSLERSDSQSLHDRCMALVYRAIAAGVQ